MSTTLTPLRVYNTLTKNKENFAPVTPGKVGIYLCGPTVYKPSHIGHMVGPVIFDTIKRYLVHSGYQVTWVVNITDVDDKLIGQSRERGIPMAAVAEEMTQDYLKNLAALGVDQIDQMPKATQYIAEMIQVITRLIEKDHAYATDGDVFFDVVRDAGYGKLSNRSADQQQGEGGEAASKKRNAGDFALWKSAKAGEPAWDSPWGKGRPGWHIECSAMSWKLLGESFDIHGGGLDLVFPHHENEIAQSECCHGKPMAKYWLHNGLMRASTAAGKVGGRGDREGAAADGEQATIDTKISRSKGAGGLADLIARQGGERIRYFLLRTHYRSTIVFSEEGIAEAGQGLDTFLRFFERLERTTGQSVYALPLHTTRAAGEFSSGSDAFLKEVHAHRASFLSKMDDDFNTGGAVSDLFDLLRTLNKFCEQQKLDDPGARNPELLAALKQGATVLRELTALLGLFIKAPAIASAQDDELLGKLVGLFIELRKEARVDKNFKLSDRIRDGLTAAGIALEDRKDGTSWRKA